MPSTYPGVGGTGMQRGLQLPTEPCDAQAAPSVTLSHPSAPFDRDGVGASAKGKQLLPPSGKEKAS